MKNHQQEQLRQELEAVGTSAAEIEELLPIASSLRLLGHGPMVATEDIEKPKRWLKVIEPLAFAAAGLALGMALVILSQAALPTSLLYPIQKFSDRVAISIYPQYRADVMMKRAQQVNQLVATHASVGQVLATLADYAAVAGAYKSTPHANYASFEYCETNLKQASASATSPNVRQAISNALKSLDAT